jgi:acid phosphatase family membrane protein YuiD
MHPFGEILNNRLLLISVLASFLAQFLKLLILFVRVRKLELRVLFETGGMPSSHSALVAALATGIGQSQGWDTPAFAIASVMAFIVMYDAAGIRFAAGKQAKVINQIIFEMFEDDHVLTGDPLKELLGHTPAQVLMGAILGISLMLVLQ